MLHKSSQQFLSLFTKSKVNLTSTVSNSTPFCQGRGGTSTHPKPKHHLHKPIGKNHPILQLIQSRPSNAPSRRLALVNKKRHGEEKTEPRRGQQRPDLRVQRRETGDEGVSSHRSRARCRGGLIARCLCSCDDLVYLGYFGNEDEVDEGVGDEEDAAHGEGGLRSGEAWSCILLFYRLLETEFLRISQAKSRRTICKSSPSINTRSDSTTTSGDLVR